MSSDAKPFLLQPNLPASAEPFVQQFRAGLERCRTQGFCIEELLDSILVSIRQHQLLEEELLTIRLFFELMQDLTRQGWGFEYRANQLVALPPGAATGRGVDQQEIKQQLRASLIVARDEQLREPTTRRFVLEMERPRWHRGQQISVLNLFVSPQDFAIDLRRRLIAAPSLQPELLRDFVQPYLQPATEDRDEFTNLRLIDIWRYCRYTWSLPLSAQPGRQMFYLVRDAARKSHPIIGIGALGSSIVQITRRDKMIGWTIDSLRDNPDLPEHLHDLEAEIDRAVNEVYWLDLVTGEDIEHPTDDSFTRLSVISKESPRVSRATERPKATQILEDTHSSLYRRKRALEMRNLLRAKQVFLEAQEMTAGERERSAWLLSREEGRQALGVAIRSIKKRHIGVSMMDITTCGALPPYSEVLGGKLVSLLMASPQIIADYERRYKEAPSEIASRMKGEEIIRPARLVLLGTTSLYYVGSSQYNRLRVPVANGELKYLDIGKTKGYGTVHMSQRTYRTLQELLRSHPKLEPESSTFAAGVNFKMRSVAAGLAHLGLNRLQKHETPRLVYLIPLAVNWREYLTGHEPDPRYIYRDVEHPEEETQHLISFWKERWLIPRAMRPETVHRLRETKTSIRVSSRLNDETVYAQSYIFANTDSETLRAGGGTLMPEPTVIPWNTLAELKDQRISIAERLTPTELEAIHIVTKLDQNLLSLVEKGHRIYLSGNPGDGKTHIIKRHLAELEARHVFVNLDASAEEEHELLVGLTAAIEENRPAVIAINEGPLRRLLPRLPPAEQQELRTQLDRPYLYDGQDVKHYSALVLNLGMRQVLTPSIVHGALNVVLTRVTYAGAPASVQYNQAMLRRPRIQERLNLLLNLVARSGAHITMHELLGFFAFILTGGEKTVERAAKIAPYYQLVFSKGSPLLLWLRELDPVRIVHPLIDMRLWENPESQIEWIETPQELPPERRTDSYEAMATFHALKRRYFFETRDGEKLLEMLPEDRKTFYDLLKDSTNARDTVKINVLEALSYFFGDRAERSSRGAQLRIWTSLRYEATEPPSAFISSQTVPSERVHLHVPRLRPMAETSIEYEPSHVRLSIPSGTASAGSVGIDIDLELWLALMKLKRGTSQRHHDPVIGRRLNHFMSRVASEVQQGQSGFLVIQVRDLDASKTHEIEVSLEKERYRW